MLRRRSARKSATSSSILETEATPVSPPSRRQPPAAAAAAAAVDSEEESVLVVEEPRKQKRVARSPRTPIRSRISSKFSRKNKEKNKKKNKTKAAEKDDDDDSSYASRQRTTATRRNSRTSPTKNKSYRPKAPPKDAADDASSSSYLSSSSEEEEEGPRTSSTTKRSPRRVILDDDDDDDGDEKDDSANKDDTSEEATMPTTTVRKSPPRSAARNANLQLRTILQDPQLSRGGDHDSDADFDPLPAKQKESDVESSVLLNSSSSSDDDEAIVRKKRKGRRVEKDDDDSEVVGFVDDTEKIGSAESSDDDTGLVARRRRCRPVKKAMATVASRKKGTVTAFSDDSSSEDNEGGAPNKVDVVCPSTHDDITGEELPEIHVCFIAPDGQSRQCFSLETMRKTALMSCTKSLRTDNAGRNHQNFLQPPHFRTPLSDDLLDQIASRFGRSALNIHGEYYKRKEQEAAAAQREWDTHTIVAQSIRDSEAEFTELLNRYVRRSMGRQDLYACPICYVAAHASLNGTSEQQHEQYATEFVWDPMSVVGHLDNDAFRVAGAFCYKRVARLKEHLRGDHGVNTRLIEGNEAYARYKVRSLQGVAMLP